MSDYQPIVRCAACDRDVIERELEAHWVTCVAKPNPTPIEVYAEPTPALCGLCAVPEYCAETGCMAKRCAICGSHELAPHKPGCSRLWSIEKPAEPAPVEKPTPVALADTIAARSARYGDFKKQAEIGEAMRAAMRTAPNWESLNPYMRLALEWITDKISRLLCGDPNYRDNWHDIAGYASLVDRELQGV